ncbi:inverse autotransporter beta domain-containing protein [Xenorhabdus santafensis]|nr:inverse autotransporter beta domain-containing protein [Xenorhabdus sp. 12]
MDSYAYGKFVRSFMLICSLIFLFISMGAFSKDKEIYNRHAEKTSIHPQNNQNEDGLNIISQNIYTVGNLLTSSPSQIIDQTKSYAVSKLNSTVATETQKWLSQFGKAKIQFSLDRKGKLDNSSLDLLFPLYDNKAEWLFFSQIGYRNKDSRNTVNFGLGGRYFTADWMYGLNTFYDYDTTGNNKRFGLGGEFWADYIKLSANTYWRLNGWHQSVKEKDYEERPANGFDLNGEFFLPSHPNLGGKLSYEQYFGDNVALFNRNTRQKNPSLGKIGLTYTPIPLMTVGIDYKYGSGGHSEALFQANINYRFGVPFSAQISPGYVASMRTLAGSRYDLVERNNNIVLDYRKIPELKVTLPDTLNGYSSQMKLVMPNIASEKPIRQVTWRAGEGLKKNGGELPDVSGTNPIGIILPNYIPNGINTYPIYAVVEDESGRKSKEAEMLVTVEPFVVKDEPQITPLEEGYTLASTITYGHKENAPLSNIVFQNIKWSAELPEGSTPDQKKAVKLEGVGSGTSNDKGQLMVNIISMKPVGNVAIYLEMTGMPKTKIHTVNFSEVPYHISSIDVSPQGPLALGNSYTFTATIVDDKNKPVADNEDLMPKWEIEKGVSGMVLTAGATKTNSKGELTATVMSTAEVEDAKISLSLQNGTKISSPGFTFVHAKSVDIEFKDQIEVSPAGPLLGNGEDKYTYKVLVVDDKYKQPLRKWSFENVTWSIVDKNLPDDLIFKDIQKTTDEHGYLTALLVSKVGMDDIHAKISVVTSDKKEKSALAKTPVSFNAVPQAAGIMVMDQHEHNLHISSEQQNRPYNVHNKLRVVLTKGSSTPSGDQPLHLIGEVKYGTSSSVVKIDSVTGHITFPPEGFTTSQGPTIVTATITNRDTKAKYIYQYSFNPQRYVFSPDVGNKGYVKLGGQASNSTCETLEPKYSLGQGNVQSMTDSDVGISASTDTENSFLHEYDGFPGLGLLPYEDNAEEGEILNTKIKVAFSNQQSQFFLYDYKIKSAIDSDPEDTGRLLCKLSN